MISLICGIQKNDTNELTYKIERDPQTQKTNIVIKRERVAERIKYTDYYIQNR